MLTQTVNDKVMLNDKIYAFGKRLVQLYLPAFATLYFALASIWGLPAAEKVLGTTAALTTFFGVVLKVSSDRYDASGAAYNGTVKLVPNEEGVAVHFPPDLGGIVDKDSVRFKVVSESPKPLPQ